MSDNDHIVHPRRVVCAAIRAADGEYVLGIRHYSDDMWRQIKARPDGAKFERRHLDDQGFVDQFGVYMTRLHAMNVAVLAGQMPTGCDGLELYSEDLY